MDILIKQNRDQIFIFWTACLFVGNFFKYES